jgi:hypothetical protein
MSGTMISGEGGFMKVVVRRSVASVVVLRIDNV